MTDAPPDDDRVSQTESGFNRLARDFDRALHSACLSGQRAYLFMRAREECWTVPQIATRAKGEKVKARPFAFDMAYYARILNVPVSRMYEAQRWLIGANMLIEIDGGLFINPDYRTWIVPGSGGQPLLTPIQIADAMEARDVKTFRGSTENRITSTPASTEKRTAEYGKTYKFVRKNVLISTENRTSATIEERTRNSAESREAEKHTEGVGGSVSDSIPDSKPESIGIDDPRHPANADDLNPATPFIHDGPTMPENFEELSRKAVELFRGKRTSFPGLLAGMRSDAVWIDLYREIPADVWHDALRDLAAVKDSTKWTPGYFLAIVKRHWRDIQEKRRAGVHNAATAAPKPKPEPEYHVASESFKARRAAFEERRRLRWEMEKSA